MTTFERVTIPCKTQSFLGSDCCLLGVYVTMNPRILTLMALVILAAAQNGCATKKQQNNPSSFSRYATEADLIVMGTAQFSRELPQMSVLTNGNGLLYPPGTPGNTTAPAHTSLCAAVETKFKIDVALKGELENDTITILHYKRRAQDKHRCMWCPSLVRFVSVESERQRIGQGEIVVPTYLLFLEKSPDGSYRPVSGQNYAGMSIFETHHGGDDITLWDLWEAYDQCQDLLLKYGRHPIIHTR